MVDPTSGLQTEINEYGPEVTADEVGALVDRVRYLAGAVSTVVFAGSLPRRMETCTAIDIAGRGIADASSMKESVRVCAMIATSPA